PPPPDTYPGLPYHTGGGSSTIQLRSCFIYGFVVGVAISPNGVSQNAENITLIDCDIQVTKSSIAICQDQSRNITSRNLNLGTTKYAFDGRSYGKGTGNCPSIFGANIGYIKYIFNTFSFAGGAAFEGIYCESTLSLGVFGGGGSRDGYVLNGCTFNLQGILGKPSLNYHIAHIARLTFNACRIAAFAVDDSDPNAPKLVYHPIYMHSNYLASFRDCELGNLWINDNVERVSFDNTQAAGGVFSRILPVDYSSNIIN